MVCKSLKLECCLRFVPRGDFPKPVSQVLTRNGGALWIHPTRNRFVLVASNVTELTLMEPLSSRPTGKIFNQSHRQSQCLVGRHILGSALIVNDLWRRRNPQVPDHGRFFSCTPPEDLHPLSTSKSRFSYESVDSSQGGGCTHSGLADLRQPEVANFPRWQSPEQFTDSAR
jgi:hypothetical protein